MFTIDVIIPAYNAHRTIDATLRSIASQTYRKNLKVYIVNDGSEKDYDRFVKKYQSFLSIVELKLRKNKGLGFARQWGIEHSNSEYIMFIDADDIFYDEYVIENIYKVMLRNQNINFLISKVLTKDEDVLTLTYTHGKVYRRIFLKRFNIKSKNFYSHEDLAFNLCNYFLCNSTEFLKIDDITYVYKDVAGSLTKVNNNKYLLAKSFLDSYYYAMKIAKKNNCQGNAFQYSIVIFYSLFCTYSKRFANLSFEDNDKIKFMKMSKKFYYKYKKYIDSKINLYGSNLFEFVSILERFV